MTSRLPLSIAILLVLLVPGGVGDAAGAHPQELQAGSGYRVSEIIKHYVLLMTPCPGNETSGEELLAAVNAAESSLASSLALATEEDAGATSEVPSTAISDPVPPPPTTSP
ncbi:hypothetical protein T484DRAFT_1773145 [Baffinella frigidus]|nr:hypothetical protein T484DRAFT_1773145 [Cryptophyta sp. CCMP2293]